MRLEFKGWTMSETAARASALGLFSVMVVRRRSIEQPGTHAKATGVVPHDSSGRR